MGFLKLILNLFLLWTVPLTCPDELITENDTIQVADEDRNGQLQEYVCLVYPAEIISSTEDLPTTRNNPSHGFLNPASERLDFRTLHLISASSSPYQHLQYERLLMYPFHSFL